MFTLRPVLSSLFFTTFLDCYIITTSNNQKVEKCVQCDLRVFFLQTTKYRRCHNLVLLKFTIKELRLILHRIDIGMRSRLSVSVIPKWQAKLEMTIIKLRRLKNNTNGMNSVERNDHYYLFFLIISTWAVCC